MNARLIPELDIADIGTSLNFYVDLVGWNVLYQRPEDKFAFLEFEGANLMLEEVGGSGRRFGNAILEHPYGRGVNFQIQVADVEKLYNRVSVSGAQILLPIEEKWYRRDTEEIGNHQFVLTDPDGYMLRFFTDMGRRPKTSATC